MVPMSANRLDSASRRDWEILTASKSEPVEFKELKKFMQERLITLEVIPAIKSQNNFTKDHKKLQDNKIPSNSSSSAKVHNLTKPSNSKDNNNDKINVQTCSFCTKPHFIAYCFSFKGKAAKEKLDFVQTSRLCQNCLGKHQLGDCKSAKTCIVCSCKHHTLLHDAMQNPASNDQISSAQQAKSPSATERSLLDKNVHSVTTLTSCVKHQEVVLLGTAVVQVEPYQGTSTFARALIDPGSEISIISKTLAEKKNIGSSTLGSL